jgi:hypothetical protein
MRRALLSLTRPVLDLLSPLPPMHVPFMSSLLEGGLSKVGEASPCMRAVAVAYNRFVPASHAFKQWLDPVFSLELNDRLSRVHLRDAACTVSGRISVPLALCEMQQCYSLNVMLRRDIGARLLCRRGRWQC